LYIIYNSDILNFINLFILYKLLKKFVEDKGKPIELFLTVKKKVYEQLKNNSEALINNLLNKIVGNEEIEQDIKTVEHSLSVSSNDIVITKLHNSLDYSKNSTNKSEFLGIYFKTITYFIIIIIFLIIKLIFYNNSLIKMYEYSLVVNVTEYAEVNIVQDTDYLKSYLFDNSIPIKNSSDTYNIVINKIRTITHIYEELMLTIYDKLSYLGKNYENFIYNRINNDITSISQGGAKDIENIQIQMVYGCKQIFMNYCEDFRFLWDYYLSGSEILLNNTYFEKINVLLRNVLRPWFTDVKYKLYDNYYNYIDTQKMFHLICIICTIIITIIIYAFFWKNMERKLEDKLITSLELLNLLPDDLKNQIVSELNKEDEDESS